MAATDHELMRRLQAGDHAAFTALWDRWQRRVARTVARLAGSPSDVDDLCQEVFLRLLRAKDRYRAGFAFSTWLYQIALNVARDAARRRQRQAVAGPVPAPSGNSRQPEVSASQREVSQRVEQALAEVPEALREVLVLRYLGELSFEQVGAVTGLPASTVRSRAQAGLHRLRAGLERRGIDRQELEP